MTDAAIKLDPRSNPKVDMEHHARAKAGVAKAFFDMGFRTDRNDPEVHYQMATVFLGRTDLVLPGRTSSWNSSN